MGERSATRRITIPAAPSAMMRAADDFSIGALQRCIEGEGLEPGNAGLNDS